MEAQALNRRQQSACRDLLIQGEFWRDALEIPDAEFQRFMASLADQPVVDPEGLGSLAAFEYDTPTPE